jgi:hypothetical protein
MRMDVTGIRGKAVPELGAPALVADAHADYDRAGDEREHDREGEHDQDDLRDTESTEHYPSLGERRATRSGRSSFPRSRARNAI